MLAFASTVLNLYQSDPEQLRPIYALCNIYHVWFDVTNMFSMNSFVRVRFPSLSMAE